MLDRLLKRPSARYSAEDRGAVDTQLRTAKSGLGLRSALAGNTQHSALSIQHSPGSRLVPVAGSITLALYILYLLLMQTHTLWQSPTLIPDRWKSVFYPFVQALPYEWVRAPRSGGTALLNVGLFLMLLGAIFAVYLLALRRAFRPGTLRAGDARQGLAGIVTFTVLALLVLLAVPGVMSTDLFSYVWYGRIFAEFGQSPLTHVPADYTFYDQGRWLPWVFWKETPSVYGPLWVMLAGVIAQAANALGGDIVYHILGHRLLADLAHIANVVLIWKLSGAVIDRYWRRPDLLSSGNPVLTEADWLAGARLGVTLAYAWNPLMLVEVGANGHNDVLMLTGVLLALWLHLTGHWRLAVAALGLAALVKAAVVVFLPGYLWLILHESPKSVGAVREPPAQSPKSPGPGFGLRRGGSRTAPTDSGLRLGQALLILAGTWVLFYVPFWEGPATLKPLLSGPAQEYFVNSIAESVRFKLAEFVSDLAQGLGWQPADFWTAGAVGWRLDWPARWGPALITGAVAFMQTWRARTFPAMLVAWGWTILAYLTIGAVWFWPWYVSWLVIVAVLVGPGRLLTATQILCASSLTLYAMFALYWQPDELLQGLLGWRSLFIMVPPLAYLIAAWLLARRRRTASPSPQAAPEPARAAPGATPARPLAVPVPSVPIVPQPVRSSQTAETPAAWEHTLFHGAEHQEAAIE